MNKAYRYSLEKKGKKQVCPQCRKKTFVRYVDNHTNYYIPEIYGRCDRENKCGYHLNPYKDGYAKSNHHFFRVRTFPKKEQPVFIPEEVLKYTLQGYEHNVFTLLSR